MTRIRPISAATGRVVTSLLAVRHRLWWLGVPAAASALVAGLLATAPAASADTPPVVGVTLAQVGNYFLFAGEGASHYGEVWYQTVGSSTWNVVDPAFSDSTYSQPAITSFTVGQGLRTETMIAMVAEGPDDTLNFWWQPLADIGSPLWHQEVLGGPGIDITTPAITVIGDDIAVAAEGTDHDFRLFWQQIGATTWDTYTYVADDYSAPTMTTVADQPNTLGIVYYTQLPFIRYLQFSYLPATLSLDPSPQFFTISNIFSPATDTPVITALEDGVTTITNQGPIDSLESWDFSGDPPEFTLATFEDFEGTVRSGVSVADLGGGVVGAAAYGPEGVNFYWQNLGGPWHSEYDVGVGGSSPPQVIKLVNSAGARLVAIGVENPDFSVNIYWQFVGDAYATWRTVSFPAGTMGG